MLRSIVKTLVPVPVRSALLRYGDHVLWMCDPRRRVSQRRLRAMRGIGRGRRCFIMGNGPSLNRTDLTLLREEHTFGLNRIYLLFEKMGFATTYLVCNDPLVLKQFGHEIDAQPMPRFINWAGRRHVSLHDNVAYLRAPTRPVQAFSTDASRWVWGGWSVTFVALQVAYYLGYDQAILIGVDHSWKIRKKPNEVTSVDGDDPDHFAPNYFGGGAKFTTANTDETEKAYTMARRAWEADGRSVVDATVGGKLDVFPKVEYASLFASR